MIGCWIMLAFFAGGGSSSQDLIQVSFRSGGAILAQEAPVEKEGRLVFRRYPDGMLISIKASEVIAMMPVPRVIPPSGLRPGEQLDIGLTGDGREPKGGPSQPGLRQGEGPGGSSTVNPELGVSVGFGQTVDRWIQRTVPSGAGRSTSPRRAAGRGSELAAPDWA